MNSNDTYKKKICKIKLIVPHNHTKMATFHTIKSGAGGLRVAEPFHPPKEKRYSWGGGRVRLHVSLGRLHLVKNHIVSKSQLPWTSTLRHKHTKKVHISVISQRNAIKNKFCKT